MKQEMKKLTTLNDVVVDVTEWQPTDMLGCYPEWKP